MRVSAAAAHLLKRLWLSLPRAQRIVPLSLAVCFSLLLSLLLLFTFGGGDGRGTTPCRWGCAARLLRRTHKQLQSLAGGTLLSLHSLTIPVARPFTLIVCGECHCDLCEALLGAQAKPAGVFAPVESLIWEHILTSAACDGTRAVVDVGANIGTFTLLAASYPCLPVVIAAEPNPLPFTLLEASVRLNGFSERVVLLQAALGDAVGRARIDQSVDARWGHASLHPLPLSRAKTLRARGVGEAHSLDANADASIGAPDDDPTPPAAPPPDAGILPVLPLSEVTNLTRHLLLLKIDTEGGEAAVLAGSWALWDSGVSVENVLVEVKLYNSKAKRDVLRHLARSAGLLRVYTYKEEYTSALGSLRELGLEGRLVDVSAVVLNGEYGTPLPHEDFWLRRERAPESFLMKETGDGSVEPTDF